jgi:hypothetical protein
MARLVLTDVQVLINTSTDISDHVASVTLNSTVNEVQTTAMGNTAITRVGGLLDNSVTLEFHQDFATSQIESLVYPLIGSTTLMKIKPTSAATSAVNPQYVFTALCTEWQPLSGAVGELATASVTWPISGTITKTTA